MKSLLVCVALLASTAARAEVNVGDKAVELDATTAKGKHFRLADMAGKWVLFAFGAGWCDACKAELPAWDKIAPKLSGKVLFVVVDIDKKQADGEAFLASLKLHHLFPVFLTDQHCPALKAYDPSSMPSTFVMDPSGVIRVAESGYHKGDEDKLAAKLLELTKK